MRNAKPHEVQGVGIAATPDVFLSHQLCYEDIAIYDNSMS
jgi:hypothetical protein